MLMCPFTSNELIGLFLDTYRGLVLVYLVYDFIQFHDCDWSFVRTCPKNEPLRVHKTGLVHRGDVQTFVNFMYR